MDRKEFLRMAGTSAATLSVFSLVQACSKSTGNPAANVDFTLDISQAGNTALQSPGGFVISNNIAVINTGSGYTALSSLCTHEGCTVGYDAAANILPCPCHGAQFSIDGAVIKGPANKALKKYSASITGKVLHITG